MKNAFLLVILSIILQKYGQAFHKESYYGDPYSVECVGQFSTRKLTKDDILYVSYIVDMLKNSTYTTIDFNASITYPARFRHLYESPVPTKSTRKYATLPPKKTPRKKFWELFTTEEYDRNQDESVYCTSKLKTWEKPSSIVYISTKIKEAHSNQEKITDSSPSFNELNKTRYDRFEKKSITPLCGDQFENIQHIIRRNIIQKKPLNECVPTASSRKIENEKETSVINCSFPSTSTRKRRSIFMNSDSGPWITSQEQEQMWALRGTSLLDSEKYDFPFPYDFDKWPGCTTRDLTDKRNTLEFHYYDNGHVRISGVSKPGWNEFPWKPTEFTTTFPRLEKYLTYFSKPWYGWFSTLSQMWSQQKKKKETRAWSRYTFADKSWKSKYSNGNLTWSRRWIIDHWSPDWNRTIDPQTSVTTRKRTLWGGKWLIVTKNFENLTYISQKFPILSTKSSSTWNTVFTESDATWLGTHLNTKSSPKWNTAIFTESDATWMAVHSSTESSLRCNTTNFTESDATWLAAQWSNLWQKAKSELSAEYLKISRTRRSTDTGKINEEITQISHPIKEGEEKQNSLETNWEVTSTPLPTEQQMGEELFFSPSMSKAWSRHWNKPWSPARSRSWYATSKTGGQWGQFAPTWSKTWTKQLAGQWGQFAPTWSKTWTKQLTGQWGQFAPTWSKTWTKQSGGQWGQFAPTYAPWTKQWEGKSWSRRWENKDEYSPRSRAWYTSKPPWSITREGQKSPAWSRQWYKTSEPSPYGQGNKWPTPVKQWSNNWESRYMTNPKEIKSRDEGQFPHFHRTTPVPPGAEGWNEHDYEQLDTFERNPPAKKPAPAHSKKKTSDEDEGWHLGNNRFVKVREFRGKVMVDIREFYEKDGELLPGKKGIALSATQWKKFKDLVNDIDDKLTEMA